ncbi:MAG: tRNA pseudouridine(55) synthase TruB [Cytophagaceae bacterium]|jgi:tRNA pseudouridine55 synthase|nr:tRNA pseudouridine(55) synthase TruB [Cytophagaceae bacterium]
MMVLPDKTLTDHILLVDKPLTWTSFDVVKKLRGLTKIKKIGHAGTLDPLATGLLVVCTGKNTKTIDSIQAAEKEYTGTITLGATTLSYDLETEPTYFGPYDHIDTHQLFKIVTTFLGTHNQVPPAHSAIWVNGKRAYEEARLGNEVHLPTRTVFIRSFELTRIALPEIDFKIRCSKGTYIRSIANDFGKALGTGAYLSALRRTAIGHWRIEDALSLEMLTQHYKGDANTL